jgi:hypothetical protein
MVADPSAEYRVVLVAQCKIMRRAIGIVSPTFRFAWLMKSAMEGVARETCWWALPSKTTRPLAHPS